MRRNRKEPPARSLLPYERWFFAPRLEEPVVERDRALRESLVAHLERNGVLTDAHVRAALLEVPRHRFVPGVSLEEAYEDRALATKEREGFVISSISQPAMIAHMLQLLGVRPGNMVLEVGTGTGYNAALLAHLTGSSGRVATVDIEPDLVSDASARFEELSIGNVGAFDAARLASLAERFDRIIVTARAEDIDAQWWRLLADGGRIVVPLDLDYGGERATGFERTGQLLRSYGSYPCAFLNMRERSSEGTKVFFPNRNARYVAPPSQHVPMTVIATRREDATPELMSNADVVIARPSTVFALQLH